ncbi:MAG: glycosyltransferase family 2 protein, partial [Minisyncoccia bacterium]
EFSAYWIMKNRIKFILKLGFIKKLTSLFFVLTTRLVKFPYFLLKGKKYLIKAQIKGFLHACSD